MFGWSLPVARRGRKRNPNAKRHQTTRELRSPPDKGTPQLIAYREALAGAGDPANSVSVLTCLFAREMISEPQMRAGGLYAIGYEWVYGRTTPRAGPYAEVIRSTTDEDSYQGNGNYDKKREVFLSAERQLFAAGQHIRMITRNLVAYDQMPTLCLLPKAKTGLNALIGAYNCD